MESESFTDRSEREDYERSVSQSTPDPKYPEYGEDLPSSSSLFASARPLLFGAVAASVAFAAGVYTYRKQQPPSLSKYLSSNSDDQHHHQQQTFTLDQMEPYLKTGDLLFLRSDHDPSYAFNYVAAALGDIWSHVAMIVRHPETDACCVATSDPNRLPLEEEPECYLKDVFGDEHPSGVGLFPLRDYINTSARGQNGLLGFRLLGAPLDTRRVWDLITSQLYLLEYPEPSTTHFSALYASRRFPATRGITKAFEPPGMHGGEAMHCSALVGYIYEHTGLLGPNERSHWRYWEPTDFSKPEASLPWRVERKVRLGDRVYHCIV